MDQSGGPRRLCNPRAGDCRVYVTVGGLFVWSFFFPELIMRGGAAVGVCFLHADL